MIKIEEINNIAHLARLQIDESEAKSYQQELSKILDFVEKISELDLKNVEPTNHILDIHNVNREDRIKQEITRDELLKNTENQKDGFIVVPKVI